MEKKVTDGYTKVEKVKKEVRQYLTVNEAADHIRVSRRTVLRWVRDGLPHFRKRRVFRIALTDLEGWGMRR